MDNHPEAEKLFRKRFYTVLPVSPQKPFMRKLTEQESLALHLLFSNHSWSNPDQLGRIILGGGEHEAGRYYILEKDMKELCKFAAKHHGDGYTKTMKIKFTGS